MKRALVACSLLLGLASFQQVTSHTRIGGPFARPARRPYPYNVVLILLDDLGTEAVAAYDAVPDADDLPQPRTPTLDSLREQGILFTNAHVDPLCSPTRAQVLTGRHGFRTGVGHAVYDTWTADDFALPATELLLPRLLGEHHADGYARAAFGKWHLAGRSPANDVDPVHPLRGFEEFRGHMGNNTNHYSWRKVTVVETDPDPSSSIVTEWSPTIVVDDALAWINAQARPFFAYVCFNPPHEPLQVPPFRILSSATEVRLRRSGYSPTNSPRANAPDPVRERRELFRAMVESIDTEIGRLLAGIEPARRETTMVIVLGDNGTVGSLIPPRLNGMRVPGYQGKRGLYTFGTRVPLIVAGPLVPAPPPGGWTCTGLVLGVDVYRTIAQVAGLTDADVDGALAAAGLTSDSRSFLDLIRAPAGAGGREYAYSEEYAPNGTPGGGCGVMVGTRRVIHRVYASGHYKYMRKAFPDGSVREELYRLDSDPMEVNDLLPVGSGTLDEAAYLDLSATMDAESYAGTELEVCQ
jgi:arylsulfatase A-like enzyme